VSSKSKVTRATNRKPRNDPPLGAEDLESQETEDQEPEVTVPLPVFESPREDLLSPEAIVSEGSPQSLPSRSTTTASSEAFSPGKQAELAKAAVPLLAGALLLAAAGARLFFKNRKRTLRMPTRSDAREVAAPIARIASRHTSVALAPALIKDLFDLGEAGEAFTEYVNAGPLTVPAVQANSEEE